MRDSLRSQVLEQKSVAEVLEHEVRNVHDPEILNLQADVDPFPAHARAQRAFDQCLRRTGLAPQRAPLTVAPENTLPSLAATPPIWMLLPAMIWIASPICTTLAKSCARPKILFKTTEFDALTARLPMVPELNTRLR